MRKMMRRAEFFEFLKGTELYVNAREDLDKLISYMSVRPEPGSLEFFFQFKAVQGDFQEELTFLAKRDPKDLRGCLTMEEAVKRVHEMREEYECRIKQMINVLEYGLEKYFRDHLDQENEYFVMVDERDRELEPYVERKLETYEEMNELACTNMGIRVIQSAWKEVYGDKFHLYFLREKVGFDRMQFNVDIQSIDEEKLKEAKKDCQKQSYSELPRIVVEYVDPDNEEDIPLALPIADHRYKKIEITLSHHVSFVFKKNNSKLEDDGQRKRDIYLLKTYVEPQPGHEILGNIGNYSYDEMGLVIQQAVMELQDLTGIAINPDTIRLNDMELNLTFRQNCDFNELMRSVSFYQVYPRKGYAVKEYKISDEEAVQFGEEKSKKKSKLKDLKMKTTGFTASSKAKSIVVKLYDKKEETIAYAADRGYDLRVEGDEALIRLEFKIRTNVQLKRYFHVNENADGVYYFKDLSQERIEDTYKELVDIFFKEPYEKKYVPESLKVLKKIVSELDTSRKGGKWKQELIDTIRSQEIWKKSTPVLLSEKDIASVIKSNKTWAKRPNDYKKILWELLKESDIYPTGQRTAYDMLYNFLHKTYDFKTLSEKRRVGYAVSDPGTELPDVSEEIDAVLEIREGIMALRSLDQDDYDDIERPYYESEQDDQE